MQGPVLTVGLPLAPHIGTVWSVGIGTDTNLGPLQTACQMEPSSRRDVPKPCLRETCPQEAPTKEVRPITT